MVLLRYIIGQKILKHKDIIVQFCVKVSSNCCSIIVINKIEAKVIFLGLLVWQDVKLKLYPLLTLKRRKELGG